jgi:hypothetical protein
LLLLVEPSSQVRDRLFQSGHSCDREGACHTATNKATNKDGRAHARVQAFVSLILRVPRLPPLWTVD